MGGSIYIKMRPNEKILCFLNFANTCGYFCSPIMQFLVDIRGFVLKSFDIAVVLTCSICSKQLTIHCVLIETLWLFLQMILRKLLLKKSWFFSDSP